MSSFQLPFLMSLTHEKPKSHFVTECTFKLSNGPTYIKRWLEITLEVCGWLQAAQCECAFHLTWVGTMSRRQWQTWWKSGRPCVICTSWWQNLLMFTMVSTVQLSCLVDFGILFGWCSFYYLSDMGFFRQSADFRRLRGPTCHFWDWFKSVEKIVGYI